MLRVGGLSILVQLVLRLLFLAMMATSAHADTVEILSNGNFSSGTVNAWTNWAYTKTGARLGFTAFTNPGPNSQDDNAGSLDLTQYGLNGLNVGPGALGAGQIVVQLGWNTCGADPTRLDIYIGSTLYASFATPVDVPTGSTAGTTTYSNGATGSPGSAIPSSTYKTWTYYPWTINLPPTVSASDSLRLSFAQNGTSSCYADTSVQSVSLKINTPTLKLTKITNGYTGSATFAGSNGWNTQSIITTSAGTGASGAAQAFTSSGVATTLQEAADPNFVMTGVNCTGLGAGGNYSVDLLAGTINFDSGAMAIGANIACTITNTLANPSLTITKTYSAAPTPVVVGETVTYTYVVTNTGNVPMQNVQVKDLHGVPAAQISLGAGGISSEVLTASGPFGASASSDALPNDGVWSKLAPGASVQFTFSHIVTQAEVDHG